MVTARVTSVRTPLRVTLLLAALHVCSSKGDFENDGSNCKRQGPPTCDLCSSSTHHYGCHAQLKDWTPAATSVVLTNTQSCRFISGDGTPYEATTSGYGGYGSSMCYDDRYHGSQDGDIFGGANNFYATDSVLPMVALHACGECPPRARHKARACTSCTSSPRTHLMHSHHTNANHVHRAGL